MGRIQPSSEEPISTMSIGQAALGWAIPWTVGAAIMLVTPAVASAQDARAELSGTWILNEEESDDPREMMERRGGGRRGPMGGMRGRMGGGRQRAEDTREAMESAMQASTQLRLTVEDRQVTIEPLEGEPLVVPTTGEAIEKTVNGRTIEIAGRWEDGKLVVERRIEGGFRVTQTYSRDPGASQMLVTVLVEGPRTVTFRRVYDAAQG